uniref:Undecaprenyl-phosphate glucose phosphotransferase n=1 Tax=Bosea sp. NBC_00436 TaxID=2969620 RepID=A0A9E7ZZ19_9HYPH
MIEPLAAGVEAIGIFAAAAVSSILYQVLVAADGSYFRYNFVGVAVLTVVTFATLSCLTGSYKPRCYGSRRASILLGLKLWGITLAFFALCVFALKAGSGFSRGAVMLHAVLGAGVICVLRAVWPLLVRRAVAHGVAVVSNVAVIRIGGGSGAATDQAALEQLRADGLRPMALLSLGDAAGEEELARLVSSVEGQLQSGRLNEIVILARQIASPDVAALVERLKVLPLPVHVVLDLAAKSLIERPIRRIGSLVLAEYQRGPFSRTERMLKRSLDVAVAVTGMLLLSPLLVLVALAVKLDSPGPVLFRQSRRGFGGRTFLILKFRSMTVADNGAVIVQAKKDDKRVTRVGRWLRRTSIDELPQLWNVLAGDMSIVGPRPHAVAHDDYYSRFIEEYAFRHHAKPGLTGWAQVKGLRGETPEVANMQARIEKDIWYIDHWSIWLDVLIIVRTVFVVLRSKAAY